MPLRAVVSTVALLLRSVTAHFSTADSRVGVFLAATRPAGCPMRCRRDTCCLVMA